MNRMRKGQKKSKNCADISKEGFGYSRLPLCREPWESYYILRRGILPCCYGNPILAPMSYWEETWNSPQIQEIRWYLSRGKLSPYCLESLGCPIVQRYLAKKKKSNQELKSPKWPLILLLINKIFFKIPGKLYRLVKKKIIDRSS